MTELEYDQVTGKNPNDRSLKCVVEDCNARLFLYVFELMNASSRTIQLLWPSQLVYSHEHFKTSLSTLNANITLSFFNFHGG